MYPVAYDDKTLEAIMSHQLKFRLVMAFFMSLFMALIMSGVIMAARIGFAHPEYFSIWLDAFLLA